MFWVSGVGRPESRSWRTLSPSHTLSASSASLAIRGIPQTVGRPAHARCVGDDRGELGWRGAR